MYDEKSATQHIKRLVDILEKPPVLTLVTQGQEESIAGAASRSRSQSQASQNNAQDGSEVADADAASEEKKGEAPPAQEISEQDEKLRKNYEEFYQVIQAHQNDEPKLLTNKDQKTSE